MGIPYVTGPNPMEVGQYIQQGFQQGRAERDKNTLAKLAQQAYNAPQDQQRGLIGQAVRVDPTAGFALSQNLGADRTEGFKQLAQGAQLLLAAPDDASRQQIHQSMIVPIAQRMGFPVKPQYDASELPIMQKFVQMVGGTGNQVQSTKVGANGNYWTVNRSGQWSDSGVKADPRYTALMTDNGYDLLSGVTGSAAPLNESPAAAPAAAAPAPIAPGTTLDVTNSATGAPDPTIANLSPAEQALAQRFIAAKQPFNVQNGQVVPGLSAGAQSPPAAPPVAGAPSLPVPPPVAGPPAGVRVMPPPKASADNAPSGYRWNADHTRQEIVPGGPADITKNEIDPAEADFYATQEISGDKSWRSNFRGKQGQAVLAAVTARVPTMAAELGLSPQDIGTNKATYAALTKTLADRTKYVTSVNQYAGQLTAQAALVESLMSKGAAGGVSPIVNRWIQAGRKSIEGDPDVTAFDNAITGLAREHQRLLTGPMSQAQLTVSAANTADRLVNDSQNPAQIRAAITEMRSEAGIAKSEGEKSLVGLRQQLSGLGKKVAPQGAPAVGAIEDGHRFRGGNPGDPNSWEVVP